MKPTTSILATLIITGSILSLSSCKNPADATTDATVSEAVAETATQGGQKYTFTPNSSIGFTGSKVTGSQSGGFKTFTGHFTLKEGTPQSGQFTIQMDSTWSDSDKLTGHLKDPDFFDVPNHPQATFIATSFTKKSDNNYDLSGNLTLRGNTKNITFPAQVNQASDTVTITAEFDINRKDFGIAYTGKKDDLIRDEVIIKLNLEAQP